MIIKCRIEGVSPLLQHRVPIEGMQMASTARKKIYIPENEARLACYQNGDGIYIPYTYIKRSMITVGGRFKYDGKRSFSRVIPACLLIEPQQIPLLCPATNEQYQTWQEIHVMPKRVGTATVVRWRPMWADWAADFIIENLDEDNISSVQIKEILEAAGKFAGLGDDRPEFGRFMVTGFKS